jgi:sulfur carrier protein
VSARVQVNGEARDVSAATVAELLRDEGLDPGRRGIAVAVNGRVVRRDDWSATPLSSGDAVEIVKPFAGG